MKIYTGGLGVVRGFNIERDMGLAKVRKATRKEQKKARDPPSPQFEDDTVDEMSKLQISTFERDPVGW